MVAHSLAEFENLHQDIYKEWYSKSNFIAILAVKNLTELIKLIKTLQTKGIKHSTFREPDLENELTGIAIEPGEKSIAVCRELTLALSGYKKL